MVFEADNIDWHASAGRLLDRLLLALTSNPKLEIIVFGSAPLQLLVERTFVSEDIDLFTPEDHWAHLEALVAREHLGKDQTDFYIRVCDPLAFRSTFDWRARAIEVERHGHLLRFVHPWDVLVSKLQRLEEKDLAAFRIVIAKTGHPTEQEFRRHLQKAVDLYRPKFDEESQRGDMLANTRILWRELWGHDIDPRAEIIRPAIERTNRALSDFDPTLKDRLREVVAKYGAGVPAPAPRP
jgi:hypothetical protein